MSESHRLLHAALLTIAVSLGSVAVAAGPPATPPFVTVDPIADARAGGRLALTGVALDPSRPFTGIAGVWLSVYPLAADDTAGSAVYGDWISYGLTRPELAVSYGEAFTNVGFAASIPLSAGRYRCVVASVLANGSPIPAIVDVTLGGPLRGWLDTPAPGRVASGPIVLAGWALDSSLASGPGIASVTACARVVVAPALGCLPLAGTTYLDLARPDVAAAYDNPVYIPSGWAFVSTTPLPGPAIYDLVIVARTTLDSAGHIDTLTFVARVTVAPRRRARRKDSWRAARRFGGSS